MQVIRQKIQKVANTDIPLLIVGEHGTGKEALARLVHAQSIWGQGNFLKLSCAASPETFLGGELFGEEQQISANSSKSGSAELAHGGTLFLNEIADLSLDLQAKLLHFLQCSSLPHLGGGEGKKVHPRLICSTSQDLAKETDSGRFRTDLYYRIGFFPLHLPALRERREDIPALAEYFCQNYEKQFERQAAPLSSEMLYYLQSLSWPGNVRELSNVMARHVLVGPDGVVAEGSGGVRDWKLENRPLRPGVIPFKHVGIKKAIREFEWMTILQALRANHWNRRKTAQALKISYRALIYKMRDAGLVSSRKSSQTSARKTRETQETNWSPIA